MKQIGRNLLAGLLLAALGIAAITQVKAQEYTFITLAGRAGSSGTNDGTGSAARFNYPQDAAVDSAGNVYVADDGNCTIRKVTPGGVVTTLAGLAGSPGSADGTGSAARFSLPYGVAVDSAGNVYVADCGNCTIRKVTPGGVVTTLAGLARSSGSGDGTGSAARFAGPGGVAVDGAGNVYVADGGNCTIRKVTPGGVVTTLAGLAGSWGTTDGTGSVARFWNPFGVAVDSAGNVYVADVSNDTIRKVTPGGVVTTLAGLARNRGSADGAGSAARFNVPTGVAVDNEGNVYVADTFSDTIRIGRAGFPPPSILTPPLTQTAEMGSLVGFWVEVTNVPPAATYQWYFSGTNALGGATNSYLELTNVQPAQAGAYTVVVTGVYGAVTSDPALLSVIPPVQRTIVPAVGLPGGAGGLLHLEYAGSLGAAAPQWFSLTNVTLGGGPQLCFDLSQPLPAQRFYRAWQTNGPQFALDMSLATEIPLAGAVGSSVRIDYINQYGPTNAWVTLDTVTLTNTTQLYFDVTMFRQPTRLYRLVEVP